VAVKPATNTVYVVDYFTRTVSVIDARHCDGADRSGCKRRPATLLVGHHPWRLTVDVATNTVYVSNFGANSVSVITAPPATAGPRGVAESHPPYIRVGHEPEGIAVDDARHLVFVTNAASKLRLDLLHDQVPRLGRLGLQPATGVAPRRPAPGRESSSTRRPRRSTSPYNRGSTLAVFSASLP